MDSKRMDGKLQASYDTWSLWGTRGDFTGIITIQQGRLWLLDEATDKYGWQDTGYQESYTYWDTSRGWVTHVENQANGVKQADYETWSYWGTYEWTTEWIPPADGTEQYTWHSKPLRHSYTGIISKNILLCFK